MHVNKVTSIAIAAAVCGSLAMVSIGPAVAATHAAERVSAVAPAPDPQDSARMTMQKLAELRMLGVEITTKARAKNPNMAELKQLQARMKTTADEMLAAIKQTAGSKATTTAADPIQDVKDLLAQLTDHVTQAITALTNLDLAGLTTAVTAILDDLAELVVAVPKMLTALPVPVPPLPPFPLPLPLPLEDDSDTGAEDSPDHSVEDAEDQAEEDAVIRPERPQTPGQPQMPGQPQTPGQPGQQQPQLPERPTLPEKPKMS
ncbi:hypothetical protein LRS74_09665 [Streptomyces sp. LX-29]|uniref:hypothetical protein n=1 Tax=Streptomyces sp. LX-29 TaxID=2900152 RepID=UPI00240D53D4|nr:hypothetical protein [Streptomyces sp. LX-29]WFB07284.1 hypothetical protein LRS74_09665 [Streptomyces sp. LX-29]